MRKLKSFNSFSVNESIDNTKNDLLKCGFEIITEDKIPDFTGDDNDSLTSYVSDNVYDFGYIGYDDFCIIHLDENRGDDLLRYENGSSDFIIKYNNELFMGSFNECENSIKEDVNDDMFENSDEFDEFVKEMKNQNVDIFYCVNF